MKPEVSENKWLQRCLSGFDPVMAEELFGPLYTTKKQ